MAAVKVTYGFLIMVVNDKYQQHWQEPSVVTEVLRHNKNLPVVTEVLRHNKNLPLITEVLRHNTLRLLPKFSSLFVSTSVNVALREGVALKICLQHQSLVLRWALPFNFITHHSQLLICILSQNDPVPYILHRLHNMPPLNRSLRQTIPEPDPLASASLRGSSELKRTSFGRWIRKLIPALRRQRLVNDDDYYS